MLDTMISSMNFPKLEHTVIMRFPISKDDKCTGHIGKPFVKAATELDLDCFTEVIDVEYLSRKNNQIYQSVEVAVTNGRMFCINNVLSTSCWLKMVPIAKDCQSSNVILMSADDGVVLKTVKLIHPGEPLLMWFTENILAMLDIPFLTPRNILAGDKYACHICNLTFECPNPLKIHQALKCNRLDLSYLWTKLAKEFNASVRKPLTLKLSSPIPSFKFELSRSPQISPTRDSSMTETLNNSANINSPTSSSQESSESGSERLPTSLISTSRKNLGNYHSAFKPYSNKQIVYPGITKREDPVIPHYQVQTPNPSILPPEVHAAQLETICSSLGKSKQGHRCIYCGKIYSRKYGLKIHIRTHTGYKPLQCKYCLRPFGDPSNLNKHVRLHADADRNTPYRCNICGKNLVRRRDLDRHMRSRHQENVGHISDSSSDELEV